MTSQTNTEKSKTQTLVIMNKHPDKANEKVAVILPLQVTSYYWNWIHDTWLNNIMKSNLGVIEGIGRLYFPNISTNPRPQQNRKIHPSPTRAFGVRYDMRLKVKESMDPVVEAQKKIAKLLTKIHEVN